MIMHFSRVESGLMIFALLLGALFFYEVLAPSPHYESTNLPEAKRAGPTLSVVTQESPVMAPVQEFSEIDERPLFSPLRKPPKEAAPANVALQAPPPVLDLGLVGIVIGPNDRFAILKVSTSPGIHDVRIGEEIGGWKLVKLDADRMVLRAGERDLEMRLSPKSGANVSGGPSFPPAVPGTAASGSTPPQLFPIR